MKRQIEFYSFILTKPLSRKQLILALLTAEGLDKFAQRTSLNPAQSIIIDTLKNSKNILYFINKYILTFIIHNSYIF